MTIVDNPALKRFELEENGLVAFASYRRTGQRVVLLHVEAPSALRGTGAAVRLLSGIVEKARTEGFKITPSCSYAVLWFRRNKNAADVLDDS